jgi:hypothetical protein
VCSLSNGIKNSYPEELEFLGHQIIQSKIPNHLFSRMKLNKQKRTDTSKQCNGCQVWFPNDHFISTQTFCKQCRKERQNLYDNTLRGRLKKCLQGSKGSSIKRGMNHSLTYDELLDVYEQQGGRCAYSRIPLTFTGVFQISIDRIDVSKGYDISNINLVMLGLNVGDWSGMKNDQDEKNGFSGWNRKKFLQAVSNNRRTLEIKSSSIRDIFHDCPDQIENSVNIKLQMTLDYYQIHKKFPPPNERINDIQLGRFWVNVKHGKVQLGDEERKILLDIDPNCLDIRPRSESSKNLSMEEKVALLVKYFTEYKEWPTRSYVLTDGFRLGLFKSNTQRNPPQTISAQNRQKILECDPHFF